MGDSLTVLRTGEKLELALATVGGLAQELPRISLEGGTRTCNREWMEYISLRNMIAGAGAILRSALARRESRGVHIREDYPVTDNREFLKNVIVDNTDPGCRLEDAVLEWMHPDPVRMGYTDYIETVIGQAEEEEQ